MTRDELIEMMATSDAEFDGRPWRSMGRGDKDRYLSRSEAALEAIAPMIHNQAMEGETLTWKSRAQIAEAHVHRLIYALDQFEAWPEPAYGDGFLDLLRLMKTTVKKAVTARDAAKVAIEAAGCTVVPNEALNWLYGAEGEFDPPENSRGAFWWRKEFDRRAGIERNINGMIAAGPYRSGE